MKNLFTNLRAWAAGVAIASLLPLSAFATVTPSTITNNTVNGISGAITCSNAVINPVTITGSGLLNNNSSQHQVKINWGDSTTDSNLGSFTHSGNSFTFTYTGTHNYSSAGSHTITVSVYGNGSQAEASQTFTICTTSTASLRLIKHVINDDHNDDALNASDFSLWVKQGQTNVSGSPATGIETGRTYTLAPGTYTVGEIARAGYDMTGISGDCAANGTITLTAGQSKTCTITNNDTPRMATLRVIKHVINDNNDAGVDLQAGDFSLWVKSHSEEGSDTHVSNSPAAGSESGTVYTLRPGSYVVGEDSNAGYTRTGITGDCSSNGNINLSAGQSKTCTITNDDNAVETPISTSTLNITTVFINDNGGTGAPGDVTITVNASSPTPASFPGNSSPVAVTFNAGEYSVSGSDLTGYTKSFSEGCNGSLAGGSSSDCTVTYNDNAGDEVPPPVNPPAKARGVLSSGSNESPTGEVLGAATSTEEATTTTSTPSCAPYLTSYMHIGWNNPTDQVSKLQQFLNKELSMDMPITGWFGKITLNAVKVFQKKYTDDVLNPWAKTGNRPDPSGYVFKTTLVKINNLSCPTLNQPIPEL